MEKLNSVFMENLRYYLDLRKKSQIDLARAVDVSSSTVSDWINGRKIPRADRLERIGRALNVSVNDLLLETRRDDPDKALWDKYGDVFRTFGQLPPSDRAMIENQIRRLAAYAAALEGRNDGK